MYSRTSTKGSKSVTRPGDLDYSTKRGDSMFHRGGKDVKEKRDPFRKMRATKSAPTVRPGVSVTGVARRRATAKRAGTKGSKSKTRPSELDFTTKKTSKDFNRSGKRQTTRQGSTAKASPFKSIAHAKREMAKAKKFIDGK